MIVYQQAPRYSSGNAPIIAAILQMIQQAQQGAATEAMPISPSQILDAASSAGLDTLFGGSSGTGSFFGSGGITAGQQAAIDSLGGDLTASGGVGSGAAGSFLSNTLPAIGSYAVPVAAAAALGWGLNKQYGKPRSRREANSWGRFVAPTGYKYTPDDWATRDTNPNPTAEDLAGSSIPAIVFGNAWMEQFDDSQRKSIMQRLLDDGGVNEKRGGYDVSKSDLAKYADESLAQAGKTPFATDRLKEFYKRRDAKNNFMFGRTGDHSNMTLNNMMASGATRNPQDNAFTLGANWMPHGVPTRESGPSAKVDPGRYQIQPLPLIPSMRNLSYGN